MSNSGALQEERITMLELRHSPWCEGLDCVDSLEEPLTDPVEGDGDLEGGLQEGPGSQDDTISSSLQLVLPIDFAPSRVDSETLLPPSLYITRHCLHICAYPHLKIINIGAIVTSFCTTWHDKQQQLSCFASNCRSVCMTLQPTTVQCSTAQHCNSATVQKPRLYTFSVELLNSGPNNALHQQIAALH